MSIGGGVVRYWIDGAGGGQCHELSEELMKICRLDALVRVVSVQVTAGVSRLAVLRKFCASFKDYPVIMLAGTDTPDGINPIVHRYTSVMHAELAGFVSLAYCMCEDDVTVMLYSLSEAGRDVQLRMDAYYAANRLSDVLQDCSAKEIFNREVSGWGGLAEGLRGVFDEQAKVSEVKSF